MSHCNTKNKYVSENYKKLKVDGGEVWYKLCKLVLYLTKLLCIAKHSQEAYFWMMYF